MNELFTAYSTFQNTIKQRLNEFAQEKTKEELFYEACFCIMAVQTKGRNADFVTQQLKKENYYKKNIQITPLLKQHVRFHNTKARRLEKLKNNFNHIYEIITHDIPVEEKRELLLQHVDGFGMKEASHYLRNTGHTGLAILDRHILRNMVLFGALERMPLSLTKKQYLHIEEELKKFSQKIGISMDELDLLFWAMNTGEVLK